MEIVVFQQSEIFIVCGCIYLLQTSAYVKYVVP
jgi:hypothetical protein